jgi:CRP/FNR family transcriptional regulator, cyclic AMP receptor protein
MSSLQEEHLSKAERASRLKQVPFLAQLSQVALERIGRICSWREVSAGAQIANYQEDTTDVFFLVQGKVRIIIYSHDGREVVFTDLVSGAMFGEIAAIDRKPRSASVEAIEACTVASLTSQQFEDVMLQEPLLALATLRHVTADMRRLSDRVLEFSTLAVRNRIHAELIRLTNLVGRDGRGALLQPAPSLSEIASRISTHREAVSRELTRLADIGLVLREGRNLRVMDVPRLAALVAEAKGE